MRFRVWEAHGTILNLLTVVTSLVPQFYDWESRNFSWNLVESEDLGSFTHKILFRPMYVVIFVMFLWLRSSSFVAAKTLFAVGERNLDLVVPVIEDRRKKVFWNIEDGIYLFLRVLGREVWLFFREGSGMQWARLWYLEYTQLPCTDCTHFPWNKQDIPPLLYVSPGTHSFFLSLFFFWHFYCSSKGFGIEIKVFGVGLLWDLKQMMWNYCVSKKLLLST